MGKHKEWRKLAKKARRKRVRQKLARERDENEEAEELRREQSPSYRAWIEEQRQAEEFQLQEQIRLAVDAERHWLEVEEESQKQWRALQEKLLLAREERSKQAQRIKEEWDREQKKLKELKEKKEKEEEDKRKEHEKLVEQVNSFVEHGGDIPEGMLRTLETNPLKQTCPFFKKTGACRFKDACSRNHVRPGISHILLIPNFYSHYSLQQTENEHGSDSSLEFESQETYQHFTEFFYDVLPEMEKCGRVRQFKVCCNHETHLRGNVYVEYSSCREAVKSYKTFYGRWYSGKQLHVEFCDVESWKSAICGLFGRQKCPKGSSCNFLHVFTNPGNLFAAADKDMHRTPPNDYEEELDDPDTRNWRWSESPEPISPSENYNSNGVHISRKKRSRDKHRRKPTRHKEKHSKGERKERNSTRSRKGEKHKSPSKYHKSSTSR